MGVKRVSKSRTTRPVTAIERINDMPLLVGQMEKNQLAKSSDEQFPMHGNCSRLGFGSICIRYIIWNYQELFEWFLKAC